MKPAVAPSDATDVRKEQLFTQSQSQNQSGASQNLFEVEPKAPYIKRGEQGQSVLTVPLGKDVDDIDFKTGMEFLFSGFIANMAGFMAAQTKLRLEKASKFSQSADKKKTQPAKEIPELSVILLVGNLPHQAEDGKSASKKLQRVPSMKEGLSKNVGNMNKVRAELLSYLFGRGFADAVVRCRQRGRCVLVLSSSEPSSLVTRFHASLAPWRFANFRMMGLHQAQNKQIKLNTTPLEYIVKSPPPQALSLSQKEQKLQPWQKKKTNDMTPSIKVKLAERLRFIFQKYRVAEDQEDG
jgi:hypothetical protein